MLRLNWMRSRKRHVAITQTKRVAVQNRKFTLQATCTAEIHYSYSKRLIGYQIARDAVNIVNHISNSWRTYESRIQKFLKLDSVCLLVEKVMINVHISYLILARKQLIRPEAIMYCRLIKSVSLTPIVLLTLQDSQMIAEQQIVERESAKETIVNFHAITETRISV